MNRVRVKLFLSCFMVSATLAAQPVIVLAYDYPPYMGKSAYSEEGLMMELVKAAFADQKVESAVEFMPAKRANATFESGKALAMSGVLGSFSPEVQKDIEAIPLYKLRFVVFYRGDRFPRGFSFTKLAELKPYSIGILSGGLLEGVAKSNGLTADVSASLDQVFTKLEARRTDLAVAADLALKLKGDEVRATVKYESVADVPFVSADATFLLYRKHPDYPLRSAAFKKGFKNIVANGTWLKVMEKFYGKGGVPADSAKLVTQVTALF